jgi:hypothetical protein
MSPAGWGIPIREKVRFGTVVNRWPQSGLPQLAEIKQPCEVAIFLLTIGEKLRLTEEG